MPRNNRENNRNKDSKGGGIIGWIVLAVLILSSMGDVFGRILPVLIMVIVFGSCIAVFLVMMKKGMAAKGDSQGEERRSARSNSRTQEYSAPHSLSKLFTQAAKDEELGSCDDEHYISASPEERRKTQLAQFYKSGIITREEYNLMRDRWNI